VTKPRIVGVFFKKKIPKGWKKGGGVHREKKERGLKKLIRLRNRGILRGKGFAGIGFVERGVREKEASPLKGVRRGIGGPK